MATTTILGTDYTTSATGLYNLLNGSDYFSSVTIESGVITCYDGTTALLMIQSTASPLRITITTKYGFTRTFTLASRYFYAAYTCSGGITLGCDNNLVPAFTITKDADGTTTLIYTESLTIAGANSTNNVFVINTNTTTPTLTNAYNIAVTPGGHGDFIKTVLAPFVINGNDGDSTSDVLQIISAQFTMTGNYDRTWVIDGVNYWSNGLWVVKDE